MRKMLSALLAALLLAALFTAAVLPVFSVTPADPLVAAIENAVTASLGKDTPGAAVVAVRNGATAMMEGFGFADMAEKTLVTAGTTFEIGELTGLFTAITVFSLAERGALSVDADITSYLPDRFAKKLKLTTPVTLRDLLSGTAGFEGRRFDVLFTKDSYMFASLEEALLSDIPEQSLGEKKQVSTSAFGISLAAYVAECATGTPFGELASAAVLTPLGLSSTVLYPDRGTAPASPAYGYIAKGEGRFTPAANAGKSYSGLPYATGAVSTPADLAKLLCALSTPGDGVFSAALKTALFASTPNDTLLTASTPAFSRQDGCFTLTGGTVYFSAALCFDRTAGNAVLTLTNAAPSALSDFPRSLYAEPTTVTAENTGGELPELKTYRGAYVPATEEGHSFAGKYLLTEACISVKVNKDEGSISFGEERYLQIAPGIFTAVGGDGKTVALQFLTDEKGDVTSLITADGTVFVPVPFYLSSPVSKILFVAVLVLAAWFLFYGLYSVARYVTHRGKENEESFFSGALPGIFAFLMSLLVLWQILLGVKNGYGTLSSMYQALSVMALLFGIGAAGSFTVAFFSSLLDSKRLSRTVRAAILFVLYALLTVFWHLVLF